MAAVVEPAVPPVKPVSALQTCPSASVYAAPPACTRIGWNVVGGLSVTVAVAVFVVSAALVAVTMTVCGLAMGLGAV